ncbi:hypothetical protein ACFLVR_05775, partial [Chloroflexota bacterium]
MNKSRYTDEQIVFSLRQAETGAPVEVGNVYMESFNGYFKVECEYKMITISGGHMPPWMILRHGN